MQQPATVVQSRGENTKGDTCCVVTVKNGGGFKCLDVIKKGRHNMCQAPEKRNFLRLPEVPPAAPTAL